MNCKKIGPTFRLLCIQDIKGPEIDLADLVVKKCIVYNLFLKKKKFKIGFLVIFASQGFTIVNPWLAKMFSCISGYCNKNID